MKRTIIYITTALFIVAGLRGCYLLTFCNYQSYFVITDKNSGQFEFPDSLTLYSNLAIEDFGIDGDQVIGAYVTFYSPYDSIIVNSLKVETSCVDNPRQVSYLSHIVTYIDPFIPERKDYVRANKFDEFPEHYKIITLKRQPYTSFSFYFGMKNIDLGTIYSYKITGKLLYRGKIISFSRDIRVKRKKHFADYQMMT